MSSPEREEYLSPTEEPVEDDGEPADDDDEEALVAAEEEGEAPVEEVDNITETIPPRFALMPRHKKRRLNPPSPTRSWRTRMTPRRSRMTRRAATTAMVGVVASISRC
jgi:hypothetical protein